MSHHGGKEFPLPYTHTARVRKFYLNITQVNTQITLNILQLVLRGAAIK